MCLPVNVNLYISKSCAAYSPDLVQAPSRLTMLRCGPRWVMIFSSDIRACFSLERAVAESVESKPWVSHIIRRSPPLPLSLNCRTGCSIWSSVFFRFFSFIVLVTTSAKHQHPVLPLIWQFGTIKRKICVSFIQITHGWTEHPLD